jgi:16S rRNA G966 N2-methylase RsmD
MHFLGSKTMIFRTVDIIFLDPPFNKDYETKILNQLFKKKDLKPSCKIYLEYSKYNEIEIPKDLLSSKKKMLEMLKHCS